MHPFYLAHPRPVYPNGTSEPDGGAVATIQSLTWNRLHTLWHLQTIEQH